MGGRFAYSTFDVRSRSFLNKVCLVFTRDVLHVEAYLRRFVQSFAGSRDDADDPIFGISTLICIYTVNNKKRDILFLTITLSNLNRFL